jgi:hypothetical protein
MKYDLDGIDVDYEDFPAMNRGDGSAENWLITFTTELRKLLPSGQYLITHARKSDDHVSVATAELMGIPLYSGRPLVRKGQLPRRSLLESQPKGRLHDRLVGVV